MFHLITKDNHCLPQMVDVQYCFIGVNELTGNFYFYSWYGLSVTIFLEYYPKHALLLPNLILIVRVSRCSQQVRNNHA